MPKTANFHMTGFTLAIVVNEPSSCGFLLNYHFYNSKNSKETIHSFDFSCKLTNVQDFNTIIVTTFIFGICDYYDLHLLFKKLHTKQCLYNFVSLVLN